MRRKVRFEVKITCESVVEVPDNIAKGPDEKTFLAGHLKKPAKRIIPAISNAPIMGMVVGDPSDDLRDSII